ncbi:hypothetical protein F4802DRAFT_450537 [Xylaria palmicola]|nr:hypothetical protein F4802DRAFT_450537 [Xylaria palmicola]
MPVDVGLFKCPGLGTPPHPWALLHILLPLLVATGIVDCGKTHLGRLVREFCPACEKPRREWAYRFQTLFHVLIKGSGPRLFHNIVSPNAIVKASYLFGKETHFRT